MHVIAQGRKEKESWKMVSMICFTVGRFGNSDPKRFPSSIKKYMPDLWDEEDVNEIDPLIEAARARQRNDKVNGR
jgi:hypothetical protein